jgi:hypothetical protein
LAEILAALFGDGRKADQETAEAIIEKLEAQSNYIPSSDRIRREYAYLLLKEYRDYITSRSGHSPEAA